MQSNDRVLVIGATRGTGHLAATRLLEKGGKVRILARSAAKARVLFGPDADVCEGDVTKPHTLAPALDAVDQIVYTAGVTRKPATEEIIRRTECEGVLNTIAAARASGLQGRFVLMGAIGTTRGSPLSFLLNLIKGNTLHWRRRSEEELRRSGLDYTIVHAGILKDAPRGTRPVRLGQRHVPMHLWHRIGRADAAEVLIRALRHPAAKNTTFDAVWTRESQRRGWDELFKSLEPEDAALLSSADAGD